ncbi:MAG: hypothetical protein AB1898_30465 [Acidobacteriota bacterium]
MTLTQQIVALIFTPAAVIAVFAYLARRLLDTQISKDLETFKAQLDRALFEHKTRYSLVHEKRAQVIGELYGKIARTASRLAGLIHIFQPGGGPSLTDKKIQVAQAAQDMQDHFNENQIYLADSTCSKVEEIIDLLHSVFVTFDVAQMGDKYKPDHSGLWRDAHKRLKQKWPPLKAELKNEFRAILQGDSRQSSGAA